MFGQDWKNMGLPAWCKDKHNANVAKSNKHVAMAHLLPRCDSKRLQSKLRLTEGLFHHWNPESFEPLTDINHPRNIMLLYKPVERAYDKKKLGFVYNSFNQELICYVFDREDEWLVNNCHLKTIKLNRRPCLRILAQHLLECMEKYGQIDPSSKDVEAIATMVQLSLDLSDRGTTSYCDPCNLQLEGANVEEHFDLGSHVEKVDSVILSDAHLVQPQQVTQIKTCFGMATVKGKNMNRFARKKEKIEAKIAKYQVKILQVTQLIEALQQSQENDQKLEKKREKKAKYEKKVRDYQSGLQAQKIKVKVNGKVLKLPKRYLGVIDTTGKIDDKFQKIDISWDDAISSNKLDSKLRWKKWLMKMYSNTESLQAAKPFDKFQKRKFKNS